MSIEHLKSAERARPEAQEIASSMPRKRLQLLEQQSVDTEAGMLSGVSRKRSIRSNPCWFTEFCKSQCLSHFAAPFIVVRAETSVAESCEEAFNCLAVDAKEKIQRYSEWSKTVTVGQEKRNPTPDLPPPRPREEKQIPKRNLTVGYSSEVKRCV